MTGDTVSSVDLTCRTESLGKISLLHLRQLGVQVVNARTRDIGGGSRVVSGDVGGGS